MWCNPVKALAVLSVGLWSIPVVYAQGALSFDDRRAQLEAQTELVAKELALQDALRRLAAPRQAGLPTIVGAWGPQINIGLLLIWMSISIGRPGHMSEVRITWPWRGEPLVVLRWAGTEFVRRWGWHYGDLWLSRLVVRVLSPRRAFGSLMRLITHGEQ